MGRLDLNLQALVRALYLDHEQLDYPHRVTARRFGLLSEEGEDGVTVALVREAGIGTSRFVEIGCGMNGGNSGFLAQELGWSGLMIDANEDCAAAVRERFPRERVAVECAWVTREGINELLARHGVAGEIDVLSIDIDGNDYWIWEAIEGVSARIVIIEVNLALGSERAVVVPYDPDFDRRRRKNIYCGASLAAVAALGDRRGYRLVATVGPNAYLLRDDVAPHIPRCEPAALHCQPESVIRKRRKLEGGYGDSVAELYAYIESEGLPLVEVGGGRTSAGDLG